MMKNVYTEKRDGEENHKRSMLPLTTLCIYIIKVEYPLKWQLLWSLRAVATFNDFFLYGIPIHLDIVLHYRPELRTLKDDWYQILLSSHFFYNNYIACVPVLEFTVYLLQSEWLLYGASAATGHYCQDAVEKHLVRAILR